MSVHFNEDGSAKLGATDWLLAVLRETDPDRGRHDSFHAAAASEESPQARATPRVEPSTGDQARPEWNVDLPSGAPLEEGSSTRDVPLGTSTWDGEVLGGDKLAAWDDDPAVVQFVDERVGDLDRGMPLAYRYAAFVSGESRRLRSGEFPQWKRRILVEGGFVAIPPVRVAALPDSAAAATRELWPAIQLLVLVRVLGGTPAGDTLPLTRRFLQGWTGMSERRVRGAMEELERIGFVRREGEYVKEGSRWAMTMWHVLLDGEEPA